MQYPKVLSNFIFTHLSILKILCLAQAIKKIFVSGGFWVFEYPHYGTYKFWHISFTYIYLF